MNAQTRLLITILVAISIVVYPALHAMVEIIYRSDVEGVFEGLGSGWAIGQFALLGTWVALGPGLMIWRSARAMLLVLWMEIAFVAADKIEPAVTSVTTYWMPISVVGGWFVLMWVVKFAVQGRRITLVRDPSRRNMHVSLATAMIWLSEVAAILGAMNVAGLLRRASLEEFFSWRNWPELLLGGIIIPIVFAPVLMCALASRGRKFWFCICAITLFAVAAAFGGYEYSKPIPDFLEDTYRLEESYFLRCFGTPFSFMTSFLVSIFSVVWLARWLGFDCIRIDRGSHPPLLTAADGHSTG